MQPSTENPKETPQTAEIKEDLYHQDLDVTLLLAIFDRLENKTIIDIGAEKGTFLQAFLDKGAAKAFAFEPYPPHAVHLRERYAQDSRVQLFDIAVGERNETVKLRIASDAAGQTYDYHHTLIPFEQTSSIHWNSEVAVGCRTLDSLLGDGSLPAAVGILKTDTEGNDRAVIAGMGNLKADVLMIEFWDDLPEVYGKGPYTVADLDGLLRPHGYSNFVILKRHDEVTALQFNETSTRSGDWGNVIFIHDRVFANVSSILFTAIAKTENILVDKALEYRNECQRRSDVISVLNAGVETRNQRIARLESKLRAAYARPFLTKIEDAGHYLARILKKKINDLILRRGRRLGTLRQHKPRKMRPEAIPRRSLPDAALPSMTIVTPSYMQGGFLERTMQSVLSQDYPKLEYIIQDGGSKDDSVEIIKRHESKLARWESERDGGQASAIRRGFEGSAGEIMGWLNSDDMLMPGALGYIGAYFANNPSVDAIYGHRVVIDDADQEVGRWVLPTHDPEILKWADYVPQETLFWRRQLFEKVGGIDSSFQFAIDWDLLVRFEAVGAKIVRLPYFLGCFRVHPTQKTSADMVNSTGDREMARIREAIHGRAVDHREIGPYVERYWMRSAKAAYLLSIGIRR